MVHKDQILEALNTLIEPQFNKSVVELNLIRDVMVKEDTVSLSLIVVTEDEGYKVQAKAFIQQSLANIGVPQVHIRFRLMTDHERSRLEAILTAAGYRYAEASSTSDPAAHSWTILYG